MRDAVVVGGGPAGSQAAALLAPSHDVLVLEEHPVPGRPVECAGLFTDEVLRMSGVSPDIFNTLYGAEVVFPGGRRLEVRSEWPKARVVDRADMDSRMADRAIAAGAEYSFSDRYSRHSVSSDCVDVRSSEGTVRSRSIVGADGHSSKVAMSLGDNRPREYIRGAQADVAVRMENQDLFRVRLGSEFAPGFFSWEIPCGDFTRVGLCTSWDAGPPYVYLKKLLREIGAEDRIITKYCGKIPLGGRPYVSGDRCMLIGDAAGQVKPVSGGGLYPAFKAAPILADTLGRALDSDMLDGKSLSSYGKACSDEFGRELRNGYRLRRMFVKLDDGKLDRAGEYAARPDVRCELDQLDMDNPSEVVRRILRHPKAALAAVPLALRCLL